MGPQPTLVYQPGNPRSLAGCGEIDVYTAPDLKNSLRLAVQGDPPGAAVTVDLSAVSFIDARGLMTLMEAEAYASVRGILLLSHEEITELKEREKAEEAAKAAADSQPG
ncbi:MAG TPA: STAS domain-containing protein [Streptosporangiaceae bacterium]|nr:STAS domain-containing protein [Streptosporangiaceae bacterium]